MVKLTLKAARVNAGLSQREAAEKLKVSNKTLCKWEKGETVPNVQHVENLCKIYNLSYDNINFLPSKPL